MLSLLKTGRWVAVAALMLLPGSAVGFTGTVATVADGDTFTLCAGETCEQIRLCGIDAPERGDPESHAAKNALVALIQKRTVLCVAVGDGTPCDGRSSRRSFKRLVAQCFIDGNDVAAELVKQGHACDWLQFSDGYYSGTGDGIACPAR